MLPRKNYDFSEIEKIFFNLLDHHNSSDLANLKRELNRFFADSKCIDIIYTVNTDKMFFGMSVIPRLTGDDAVEIAQSDTKIRIKEYYIEIDSKLVDVKLGLNKRELTAVLLHEVGHMINDSTPVEELRKALDMYFAQNNESLIITDSIHYRELLAYGFKDTLRKITSIFENQDEESLADQFVIIYGYGTDLCTAFDKINKNLIYLNIADKNKKLSTLIWTMRLYKDIKHRRIDAINTMKKGKNITPSMIEKKELDMLIKRLERIDDEALIESVIDDMKSRFNNSLRDIKFKGIRSIEDDYYEFSVRLNNIESEDEALFLLREINTKLAIIDDYVHSEKNLSDKDIERWYSLMHKIEEIRFKLKDKKFDKNKYYSAVVVNYPDIKQR